MAAYTYAGDISPYNEKTDWANEEKYLSNLAKGGNTWAVDQLSALYAARDLYSKPKENSFSFGGGTSVSVNDQSPLINDLYKAQQDAALAELKSAYDENVLTMDAAAKKIPGVYQQSRNRAAADADVSARNFNQYAAANGLNTGAAGQTQLAMRNQLQSGLSDISRQEADAMASLELERSRLQTQYQNAVAQAIATGDLEKAKALYSEAVRVDEMMISTAYQQAQLALQQAQHERNLANDKFEQDLALEQLARKYSGGGGGDGGDDDDTTAPPLAPALNQRQLEIALRNAQQFGSEAASNILIASALDPHNTLTEEEAKAIANYLGW